MILNYKLFETKQEAESFLNKKDIDIKDEKYIELKQICEKTPALLGVSTKLLFSKKMTIDGIKFALEKLNGMSNQLKRDKLSIQNILVDALKTKGNSSEYIADIINEVETKTDVYKFINSLQHKEVRNELKDTEEYYNDVEAGIISLREKDNWEEELKFISSKSARFKSANEVVMVFKKLIKNVLGGFSPESISKRIKETAGAILLYNKFGYVVAQVFTKEASCNLGSSSWCISGQYGNYFMQYADPRKLRQQYFIWNTNLEPTDNKSIIGLTTEKNGRVNTAHYKNDRHMSDSKKCYTKLVKQEELDQDFLDIVFGSVDSKNNFKVKLYYSLYGDRQLKTSEFKEGFQDEWKNSDKKEIDTFYSLFNMFMQYIRKIGLVYQIFLENREYVQIKRIYDKLLKLALKYDPEKIVDFLIENDYVDQYSDKKEYGYYLTKYILDKKELDPLKVVDILFKIMYKYPNLYTYNTFYPKEVVIEVDNNIEGDTLYIRDGDLDVIKKINAIERSDFGGPDFQIVYKKYSFKNIIIKTDKVTTDVSLILPQEKLSCDHLTIENNSSFSTYSGISRNINIRKSITFKKCTLREKAYGHVIEIIDRNNIETISFIDSDISALNEHKYTKISNIKEVNIFKTNFNADLNDMFNKIGKLTVEYSILMTDLMKTNSDNIIISSDVLYGQVHTGDLLDENKVKVLGGLQLHERMNSVLLSKLYKKFEDKDKFKRFLSMLAKNNIDINSIDDDKIKYLPSISLKYSKEFDPRFDYMVIGVSEEEGFKYFLYYIRGTAENTGGNIKISNRHRSRGHKLYFIDDKLNSVNKTEARNRNIESEYDFIADKIPNFNELSNDSDYVILIELTKVMNTTSDIRRQRENIKKGSPIFQEEGDIKKDFVQRYKNYIKGKYVFDVNGEKETIDFLNNLLIKITTLNNVTHIIRDSSKFFKNIKEYLEGKESNKKSIDSYVSRNIQSASMDYTPIVNNYYYKNDLGDKIYPDADKLNTIILKIEELQKLVKKGLKQNRVDIEFIEDFDILTDKYYSFVSFLDRMITRSSIPLLFGLKEVNLNDLIISILNNEKYYPKRDPVKQIRLSQHQSVLNRYYTGKENITKPYHDIIELESGIRSRSKIKEILNDQVDTQIQSLDNMIRKVKIFSNFK